MLFWICLLATVSPARVTWVWTFEGTAERVAAVAVNHLGDEASKQHFQSMLREASQGARLIESSGDIGKRETGIKLVEAAVEEFESFCCECGG